MSTFLLFAQILHCTTFAADILTGVATNPKGEVVYIERHEVQKDASDLNQFIRVEYSTPDGVVFATMTSDFSNHKAVPNTVFEDKRFGSKTIMKVSESKVRFEEYKNEKRLSKKEHKLTDSMVASQGFDNFIKINSEKLLNQPVEFKFGVLEEKDFYTLVGYKKATSDEQSEFGIKANSWLLRLFANELTVVYDAKTRRLKSFSGRSNILDASGKAQDVTIRYQWAARD